MKVLLILTLLAPALGADPACTLGMDPGQLCQGENAAQQVVARFYFDGRQCRSMVYAGCGGNANRFESVEECKTACARSASSSTTNPTCGDLEVFDQCQAGCQPTCDSDNLICPMMCVPGCICKPGFVRHEGRCIKPSECPASDSPTQCPPNEVYDDCGSGCPAACDGANVACSLTAMCIAGCRCRDGYVRLNENVCVKQSECPNPRRQCQTDADCPPAQRCPRIQCLMAPCPQTYCQDDPPYPDCTTDAQCPTGQRCIMPPCLPDAPCSGMCVASPVDPPTDNACMAMQCPRNSACVVDANGRASCQDIGTITIPPSVIRDPPIIPAPTIGCASMLCAVGYRCVEAPGMTGASARCVPAK